MHTYDNMSIIQCIRNIGPRKKPKPKVLVKYFIQRSAMTMTFSLLGARVYAFNTDRLITKSE